MGFRFESSQAYQIQAIEAVLDVLEGTTRNVVPLFEMDEIVGAVANVVDLDDETMLRNLQTVQVGNGIKPDKKLLKITEWIPVDSKKERWSFPNLSVEMETGTGKTYVYLRTIHQLFQRYAMRKFIIVVPSIAIREGVRKTLEMTGQHFRELYGAVPVRHYLYESANLARVRQFAVSDAVEIMVMTIDSFTREGNVIFQQSDKLGGRTAVDFIRAARPVIVLDEPQTMESERRVRALSTLKPSLALRYSATHVTPYNLVYRLTPYDAYRQGLVKSISVAGVTQVHDVARPFIRVDSVRAAGNRLSAKLTVHKLQRDGTVKEKAVVVKPGDDLGLKTNRSEYQDLTVDVISKRDGSVAFAPMGLELAEGESTGTDRDAIWASQISFTIEEHFRKQRKLLPRGIKVLSLFFLDRVADWQDDDGVVRQQYITAFNDLKARYPEWEQFTPLDVAGHYFAQQKKRSGEVLLVDSTGSDNDRDAEAYNAIMRDKEKLLCFDQSPVAFIFSHSALGLGWDNPNIFQICTLRQSASPVKKRQEVGRGMRLCVDQELERVHDTRLNELTVVANESYDAYVRGLQDEIEAAYGAGSAPPRPGNARERTTVSLRPHELSNPAFVELWRQISEQTRYEVNVNTEALVEVAAGRLDELVVNRPRVEITRGEVDISDKDEAFVALRTSGSRTVRDLTGRYALPNLVDAISALMMNTSPPVYLTRSTILQCLRAMKNLDHAMANPGEFAVEAVRAIKGQLVEQLVVGVRYVKTGNRYEVSGLDIEFDGFEQSAVPTAKGPYDKVVVDSGIERAFVEGLNSADPVRTFLKLPGWFAVPTPIGQYNPDWAIVWQDIDEFGTSSGTKLYLVRETKSTTVKGALRATEERKIACAERHFTEIDVDYEVITNVGDLPHRVS